MPVHKLLKLARFGMLVGCAAIAYSWGNTAFGPIGDIIFWMSYMVYRVTEFWVRLPEIREASKQLGPDPTVVALNYLILGKTPPRKG